ncbi:MAG: type II secretion system protein [Fuerstiella sp.]|nr:type II secretion system protein [Fuerstiella sp.]
MKSIVTSPASRHRRGVTLLEILLASVILAVALSALTQRSFVAAQAARRIELETEAAVRCSSRLNELMLEPGELADRTFGVAGDHSGWHWEATVEPTSFPRTRRLQVRVWQEGPLQRLTQFRISRLLVESPESSVDQSVTEGWTF